MKWERIKRYSRKAGKEVRAVCEAAYLTMQDPNVSWRQKAIIVASIGYLLLPVDAIPDFLPGGFADDLSVMLGALYSAGKVGKQHLQECRLKYGLVEKNEEIIETQHSTPPPE